MIILNRCLKDKTGQQIGIYMLEPKPCEYIVGVCFLKFHSRFPVFTYDAFVLSDFSISNFSLAKLVRVIIMLRGKSYDTKARARLRRLYLEGSC